MLKVETSRDLHESTARRAEELFQQHRHDIFQRTDRLFARLMLCQWLAGIVVALCISPKTWAGQSTEVHIHVWAAIFLGGAVSFFPMWMTRLWAGSAFTRYSVAVGQTLMSALLIGLTGGRVETHFHVFGSLVILSFYRDWRVLVPATILVALDHFVRGIYWPYSVYGVLAASPWRSIEHAGWVIFEDIFLVISCLRSVREMRAIAKRTAEVEAGEERFRTIFEEAPVGMAVVGLDQRLEQVNARLCQMVGYTDDELTKLKPCDITHPEDIAAEEHLVEQVLDGKMPRCVIEKRFIRKDKEVRWITRTTCLIRDSARKPRYYLAMMEDITERKRSERALQLAKEEAENANCAKSEFLSRMSHELRTPLNAILGFAQLMERQSPTDVQRGRINHIVTAGRHLLDLINEVLDISCIEAGRLPLSLEPVCVSDTLQEALDLMKPLAAQRGIGLAGSSSLHQRRYVKADRQRLKQVVLNLLANAIKYSPADGKVALDCSENAAGVLRIMVSDAAGGIPEDKLARLFVPFDRLDAEQSEVQGTGLGLALSKRLMEAMGGTIGVKSTAREGSTFWIELPLTQCPVENLVRIRKAGTALTEGDYAGQKRKVLYIEDNLSNLTLVEQLLTEKSDIELMTAMQGRMGLELAREHSPDLILLDLHLPDLPGWKVLARLKADEATRAIPVIVISADATARQIKQIMDAGARAYLTKPLDVPQFFHALEQSKKPKAVKECMAA